MMGTNTQFFKAPVFEFVAKELYRRYYVKGEFGTAIGLKTLREVDTEPLARLLGYTIIAWDKKKRIQLSELEAALQESAVHWTLAEFVEFITKEKLVMKATIEQAEQQRFQQFLREVQGISPLFCQYLTTKQLQNWHKQEDVLRTFTIVEKALQKLPTTYTRLPVFAYQQTGNPHVFDDNQPAGILLLQMLTALSTTEQVEQQLASIERKNLILDEFYLLKDDINNDVAVRGLLAANETAIVNQMWEAACQQGCSWNIPLKEVLRMATIYPDTGAKVLIVENSGVYSVLLDALPKIPMVCSSGQFTYAVWKLLRKLTASNTQLFYVGDMDPEGLVMAQQLVQVFPEHCQTIAMNHANYQTAAKESLVSETRLKQLRLMKDPQLKRIANQIRETKQIALQEGFIEELIWEVLEEFE